jgi:hypothetical protein
VQHDHEIPQTKEAIVRQYLNTATQNVNLCAFYIDLYEIW